MNTFRKLKIEYKGHVVVFVLLLVWLAIVAVRAVYTRPPSLGWFIGILAGAVVMFVIGWIVCTIRMSHNCAAYRERKGLDNA